MEENALNRVKQKKEAGVPVFDLLADIDEMVDEQKEVQKYAMVGLFNIFEQTQTNSGTGIFFRKAHRKFGAF